MVRWLDGCNGWMVEDWVKTEWLKHGKIKSRLIEGQNYGSIKNIV